MQDMVAMIITCIWHLRTETYLLNIILIVLRKPQNIKEEHIIKVIGKEMTTIILFVLKVIP